MTDFLDFKTFKRSPKPNNFLVAPDGMCASAEPDLVSPHFSGTAASLFQTLLDDANAQSRWTIIASDPEHLRIKLIAQTALLRFKDDIDIAVLPLSTATDGAENSCQIAIYSRSRVGYSDLGANRKRVMGLFSRLPEK